MVKNPPASAGDTGSVPGPGRSPGGGISKPTPIFLPGKSHRQRSLAGYSPWGHKESNTTELEHTCGMWDLNSPLGIEPASLAVVAQNLNHWPARKSQKQLLIQRKLG